MCRNLRANEHAAEDPEKMPPDLSGIFFGCYAGAVLKMLFEVVLSVKSKKPPAWGGFSYKLSSKVSSYAVDAFFSLLDL